MGEEISFKDTHVDSKTGATVEQTRRYDLVVKDKQTGKIVKASEKAAYNKKQRTFDERINNGTSNAKGTGKKADAIGVTKVDEVKLVRLCK